jgi:enamine deaminase RidA (YjgF/YER057c/UK114 family)
MPRSLDPDLLAAMNSGNFIPYFNVQLMDVDRTSVQFETTEVVEFALNGLTAKVVFHDPGYFDDYYMFRIQRGVQVDGVPNIITSSNYWPTYDRHENYIRTIEGHVFPNQYYTTPGDVTYSSIIATVCAQFGFDVIHEDPAADWLSYQFLPNDRTLVLNNAKWFFTLLRQKYLVFATDYDDDTLYFFQAKSTGPTFPGDYALLQANHVAITGHGAFKEKTLFSRDENNSYHYSGGTDKPIHNLGFLPSTASHPDNYSFIDTQNWIIQNIAPNLKYLDFDPVYVVLDFGEFSIWPSKFVELYNPRLSPSWQWQARFLDVFGDTEGGAMPNTIQPSAPFTPLSTLNFDHNLDETITNLQALAEAVDELSTLTGGKYILHSLATAVSDFLVASGAGAFVKKTLAEVKTILGLGTAAYTSSADYVPHSLATAVNDFIVASGAGAFVKKTLAEVKTILGLGSAAYTASTDYVPHSLATAVNDFLIASGAGAFVKKTLAETKTILNLPLQTATCYNTATQSINNDTWTNFLMNAEVNDDPGWHDPVSNTERFTIPIAGTYQVIVQNLSFAANATGLRQVSIVDSDGNQWAVFALTALPSGYTYLPLIGQRAGGGAGKYVKVQVYQNSGAALVVNAYSKVTVNKII